MSRRRQHQPVGRIVQPKALPGEVAWDPPYQYECPSGHEIGASRPVTRCPVATCAGQLQRFGKGSRGTRVAS